MIKDASTICKEYDVENKTYSGCEHYQSDHEIIKCGDIWCKICLAICVFCEECTKELNSSLQILSSSLQITKTGNCVNEQEIKMIQIAESFRLKRLKNVDKIYLKLPKDHKLSSVHYTLTSHVEEITDCLAFKEAIMKRMKDENN